MFSFRGGKKGAIGKSDNGMSKKAREAAQKELEKSRSAVDEARDKAKAAASKK